MKDSYTETHETGMGGGDSKPNAGVGASLPTIPIAAPNTGRNYPANCLETPKFDTVGGNKVVAGHEAANKDLK